MATAQSLTTAQQIYIAFYQRPADPAGLRFWADQIDLAGGNLSTVINNFASSPEATTLYGVINASTIGNVVAAIYQAAFGRAPAALNPPVASKYGPLANEAEFYTKGFAAGDFTPGTIALAILQGAQGADAGAVLNKVQVANAFTVAVDGRALTDATFGQGTAFAATYNGADVAAARGFLTPVTSNPTSVPSAAQITAFVTETIANTGDPIKNAVVRSLTLTNGLDSGAAFAGSAGNDAYTATVLEHLQSLDTFDGSTGANSLNILDVAGVGKALQDVQLSGVRNVQTINTTTDAVNLGAAATVAGVTTLNLVDNVGAGKAVDLTDFTGANITVNGASSTVGDILTVSLANAGNKTANLGGGQDQVNVNGGSGTPVLTTFSSAGVGNGTAQNVTIAGPNGNVVLDDEGVTIVGDTANQFNVVGLAADGTVDQTQNRGNFQTLMLGTSAADTLTTVGAAGNVYINAGSGNDTLTSVAAAGARHFLVGGAGNDTLNISGDGTTVAITGGGNDTVNVTGGTGQQNISLISGVNVVTFANGTLVANQANPAAPAVNTNDVVTGGTDATDTLRATATDAAAAAANGALANSVRSISGIEVLGITTALANNNIVLANVQTGLNQATLEAGADNDGDGTAGAITFATGGVLNLSGSALGAAAPGTNVFVDATIAGNGTTDALTINNTAAAVGGASVDVFSNANINGNGVENLTINTSGNGTATVQVLGNVTLTGTPSGTPAVAAATTVNLAGSNSVNALTITTGTLNAAGLTGTANVSATTNAANITGSGGDDTLVATTGNVTANLGAGADRITVNAAGVVNLSGAAGADSFAMGNTLTSADVIDGGSERDTLEVDGGAYVDNIFNQITNVEILSAGAGSNVTFNAIANGRAFDTVNLAGGNNQLTVGEGFGRALTVNLGAGTDNVNVNAASATVLTVNVAANNLSNADAITAVAGRANVLNVTAVDAANANLTFVAGIQTLNIVDAGAGATPNPVVNTTVTLGGNTSLASVNGGAVNDNLTINAGTSAATSITTGSGNDRVTAANSAATISTGAGNDSVEGNAAVDTVNLGAGNDLVTGNGGADSLIGGTGADLFRYVALADSAGAAVDTITDFVGGVAGAADTNTGDRIQVSTAILTNGAALNFAGNQASFGAAQGAIVAGGAIDYVFQADTNTLWVDVNNDGALNGSDLQIKLQGVAAIANGDVVLVDVTAPADPTIDLNAVSDSGASNTDNITNAASPLSVRFVLNGMGVNAPVAGDVLNVLGTGNVVAQAYTLVAADIAAGFKDLNVAFTGGSGVKTISATLTDAATNVSSPTATLAITVDQTAPVAPTVDLADASDSGASNTDNLTNLATVTINGTAEAGSTVSIAGGAGAAVVVMASGAGTYTANVNLTANAINNLSVTATDVAGNASAAGALAVTHDNSAPAAPNFTVADNVGPSQGNLAGGARTDDNTLTFSGTVNNVGPALNDRGTVTVFANGIQVGTAAVDQGTGNWTLTTAALTDGALNFTTTLTDRAGNTSPQSAATTLTVDTAAPTQPTLAIASATGIQNTTLNAGDVVTVTATFGGVNGGDALVVTGAPQLALNIGGTTVQAAYAAASPSTNLATGVLAFTYTILAAQTDVNGISIDANAVSLNGGTIRDTAGNNAVLTSVAVADNAGFRVDTTAPTPTITAVDFTNVGAGNNFGLLTITGTGFGALANQDTINLANLSFGAIALNGVLNVNFDNAVNSTIVTHTDTSVVIQFNDDGFVAAMGRFTDGGPEALDATAGAFVDAAGNLSANGFTGDNNAALVAGNVSAAVANSGQITDTASLVGQNRIDTLTGDALNATSFRGNEGNDILNGVNSVADTFIFTAPSATNVDTINNFLVLNVAIRDVLDFGLNGANLGGGITLDGAAEYATVAAATFQVAGANRSLGFTDLLQVGGTLTNLQDIANFLNVDADGDPVNGVAARLVQVADADANTNETILIIRDNGNINAGVYLFRDSGTPNTTIEAAELTHLATLVGTLDIANFTAANIIA